MSTPAGIGSARKWTGFSLNKGSNTWSNSHKSTTAQPFSKDDFPLSKWRIPCRLKGEKPDPWQHRYELAQGYLQGHGNLAVLMGIRPETAVSRQVEKIERETKVTALDAVGTGWACRYKYQETHTGGRIVRGMME